MIIEQSIFRKGYEMKKLLLFLLTMFLINSFVFPAHAETLEPIGIHRITFYCNCEKCCGRWANGRTASGTIPARYRTIAVSTKEIPFGTVVKIDGFEQYRIAEDTGVAPGQIDVYVPDHEECLRLGLIYRECFIVKGE